MLSIRGLLWHAVACRKAAETGITVSSMRLIATFSQYYLKLNNLFVQ